MFKFAKERGKYSKSFSSGKRRRLHCALALVYKPRVLFLDELTVDMNPLLRENFGVLLLN